MRLSIVGPVLLVGSPSELGGLLALLDVALDRPGVDELLQREKNIKQGIR